MMKVAFSSSQGMRGTYGKNGKPGDAVSSNYLAKPGITLLETFLSNDNSAVIFCAFFLGTSWITWSSWSPWATGMLTKNRNVSLLVT